MDSLAIQDAFEPYYAGRNRDAGDAVAARKIAARAAQPAARAEPTKAELSDDKPVSTTEH